MKTILRRQVNCASFCSCCSPREEIYCATPAKANSAVMANDTMPVVVLFVLCAMFMCLDQDVGGDIKARSELRQPTLLSFGGAAILAVQVSSCTQEHRQTWLQASTELSQCCCRLRRSKLALSKLPPCLCCM